MTLAPAAAAKNTRNAVWKGLSMQPFRMDTMRCMPWKKYPLGTDKRVVLDFLAEMENMQEGDDDNGVLF